MWVEMSRFRRRGVGKSAECGWKWVDSAGDFFRNTYFVPLLLTFLSIKGILINSHRVMKIRYKLAKMGDFERCYTQNRILKNEYF
jgi:hypothetical protein